MIDIIDRLIFDAARCEATFSKGVAGNITEGADEIKRLRAQIVDMDLDRTHNAKERDRLRDLVLTLIDNDPYAPIADNGMTVLDGWRERARKELGIPF